MKFALIGHQNGAHETGMLKLFIGSHNSLFQSHLNIIVNIPFEPTIFFPLKYHVHIISQFTHSHEMHRSITQNHVKPVCHKSFRFCSKSTFSAQIFHIFPFIYVCSFFPPSTTFSSLQQNKTSFFIIKLSQK